MSRLHKVLRNPTSLGEVAPKGQSYPGERAHRPHDLNEVRATNAKRRDSAAGARTPAPLRAEY